MRDEARVGVGRVVAWVSGLGGEPGGSLDVSGVELATTTTGTTKT